MAHTPYIAPSGKAYPSVTEILGAKPKPWLQKWKDKWGVLADRKTRCANDIGTRFHAGVEDLVWGHTVISDGRLYGMLNSFSDWLAESDFRVTDTELHVVSHQYEYAGTLDAVGVLPNGGPVICDWKTSSSIYPDFALQLAAYAQAYKEQTKMTINRGLIVHVSKDKPHYKLTVKEYRLTKNHLNQFLKRLQDYRGATA